MTPPPNDADRVAALLERAEGHTPGPWELGDDDSNGQAIVRSEHTEIATCWHHCVGSIEKQMRANAALIAAAPEAAATIRRLQGEVEALRGVEKAAAALLAKVDECAPYIGDAFLHRQLRCGPYRGPNYAAERDTLRAALAGTGASTDGK